MTSHPYQDFRLATSERPGAQEYTYLFSLVVLSPSTVNVTRTWRWCDLEQAKHYTASDFNEIVPGNFLQRTRRWRRLLLCQDLEGDFHFSNGKGNQLEQSDWSAYPIERTNQIEFMGRPSEIRGVSESVAGREGHRESRKACKQLCGTSGLSQLKISKQALLNSNLIFFVFFFFRLKHSYNPRSALFLANVMRLYGLGCDCE